MANSSSPAAAPQTANAGAFESLTLLLAKQAGPGRAAQTKP